jgi:hypothetical protein
MVLPRVNQALDDFICVLKYKTSTAGISCIPQAINKDVLFILPVTSI